MTEPAFDDRFRAGFLDLLRWRRDVRRFQPRPLSPGTLERLLAVAALAPSVGLSEPWRFVIVDDPVRRARVRALFEACNAEALGAQATDRRARYAGLKLAGLDEAPHHVAVFVEPDPAQGHGLGRRTMPETVAYSAAMAIHTLWLAARAEGIGLGWVSILEPASVPTILDVPEEWRLVGYLCISRPAEPADEPALQRDGWEHRGATDGVVLRR